MTAESQARMVKAQKIAQALLAQAPASRWIEAGVERGTEAFWLAAAEAAGTNPPTFRDGRSETAELVVALIRTADELTGAEAVA
jgi:hypothetical protein